VDAVWVVDSGGLKEACVTWECTLALGRLGCYLANTTEPYMCGGDAAFCQITYALV